MTTLEPRNFQATEKGVKGKDEYQDKKTYEQPHKDDGLRVLVDRLWPRGLTKDEASVDLWLKEIAPSTELRKWFAHDPDKWKRFRGRYETELRHHHDLIAVLKKKATKGTITLIYGARDEKHNEALVLKQFLEKTTSIRILPLKFSA